jgi:Protein of unknown function (DUF3108)
MLNRRASICASTVARGLLVTACLATYAAVAEPALPEPFKVSYHVSYRGIGAGRLVFELKRTAEPGRYEYVSTARPNLLARLVVSSSARESSVLVIDREGVRPLTYRLDDGKSSTDDDASLDFDWDAGRVTGTAGKSTVDLPLEPGLEDRMSIQIEVMADLLAGREPGAIGMIDDGQVKEYIYTREGPEHVKTSLGEFDAVIYSSTRPGSSRVARFWYAEALGYLPVRAEQVRKGRVETVMEIAGFSRPAQ